MQTLLAALTLWANSGSKSRLIETREFCLDGHLSREEALALRDRLAGRSDDPNQDETHDP
jgi:hypothetical protein